MGGACPGRAGTGAALGGATDGAIHARGATPPWPLSVIARGSSHAIGPVRDGDREVGARCADGETGVMKASIVDARTGGIVPSGRILVAKTGESGVTACTIGVVMGLMARPSGSTTVRMGAITGVVIAIAAGAAATTGATIGPTGVASGAMMRSSGPVAAITGVTTDGSDRATGARIAAPDATVGESWSTIGATGATAVRTIGAAALWTIELIGWAADCTIGDACMAGAAIAGAIRATGCVTMSSGWPMVSALPLAVAAAAAVTGATTDPRSWVGDGPDGPPIGAVTGIVGWPMFAARAAGTAALRADGAGIAAAGEACNGAAVIGADACAPFFAGGGGGGPLAFTVFPVGAAGTDDSASA
jgi:hypothetical protein